MFKDAGQVQVIIIPAKSSFSFFICWIIWYKSMPTRRPLLLVLRSNGSSDLAVSDVRLSSFALATLSQNCRRKIQSDIYPSGKSSWYLGKLVLILRLVSIFLWRVESFKATVEALVGIDRHATSGRGIKQAPKRNART